MKKNITMLLLVIITLFPVTKVFAEVSPFYTDSYSTNYFWANETNGTDYFTHIDVYNCSDATWGIHGTVEFYNGDTGTAEKIGETTVNGELAGIVLDTSDGSLPSNVSAIKIRSLEGNTLYVESVATSYGYTNNWSEPTTMTCKDPSTTSDGSTDGTTDTCSTTVCECINDLKAVNETISSKMTDLNNTMNSVYTRIGEMSNRTNGNLQTLITDAIERNNLLTTANDLQTDTNSKLDTVNQNLNEFHEEFQTVTDVTYQEAPSTTGLLEKNEPSQPTSEFTDNTTYFQDQGNATNLPTAFPQATEPKDWEGVTRETQLSKEPSLDKETELTQDTELSPGTELIQEEEMSKQTFTQDQEKSKTGELSKTNTFEKETELQQESTNYELRWKSSDR